MTHPISWLLWLAAAAIAAWSSRNPLALMLVLLCIQLVLASQRASNASPLPVTPGRFAVLIVPLAALFNALWTRAGDSVLFRLPAWLPVLGGPVTLEALAFGALNGLALACLFSAFAVLSHALPMHTAVGLIPRALHPVAVVVVIAVSYIPFAMRQARAVRDAQAVRGHALRGVRDWLPLFVPMLAGALEHALNLAEAMTARGYAHVARSQRAAQWLVIGGLLSALTGWLLRTISSAAPAGWLVTGVGAALIALALWRLRQVAPRTTYRRHTFGVADAIGIAGAALAASAVLAPLPGREMLFYTPYPLLSAPAFAPLIGLLLCGLSAPAVLALFLHSPNDALAEVGA